jgi:FAD/FMN-containing dehydrogenase
VKYVRELDVVLANGELIHTLRLSKRELNRKKGLTTFEGEIYRQVDGIVTDNWDKIQKSVKNVSKNSTGYNLADVKRKDGSFDLTPLFVGSQGTLGVITQATITTESYNPNTTLISAHFKDLKTAKKAILALPDMGVSALEVVDKHLLEFVHQHNPQQLKDLVEAPFPEILLLAEFDDTNDRKQKRNAKRAIKLLADLADEYSVARDEHEREMLWKIRHSAATISSHDLDNKRAVPIIEDGVVPRAKFTEYVQGIYALFEKYKLEVAMWGHGGDGNLHVQPFLDLSKVGDRQKVFKIMDEYYEMVLGLGGSTSGEHNDGRLRGSFLPAVYGDEIYELFRKVKKAFDPYGTMNPGVKIDVKREDVLPLLRKEYSVDHLLDHMPRL